jgi:chromate transporter
MELLKLAGILFLINSLTIGGGYAMMPLLQKELVQNHHWLTNKEFIDAIAIGQVTPGPLTVMNAFMGFKVAGLLGAIVAMVASYLPCVFIVTFVTHHYLAYRESRLIKGSFAGIKPAVVGLLGAVLIFLGKTSVVSPLTAAVAGVSFGLIAFTKLDPTFVILGSGVIGAFLL